MDHLYRLSDPFPHDEIQVPYLCNDDYPYTGTPGEWHSFPQSCGWQQYNDDDYIRQNPQSWAAFIQTWLYFGLLSRTLRAPVISRSLVRESGPHSYLCTENLPYMLLMALRKARDTESYAQRQERKQGLTSILDAQYLMVANADERGPLPESVVLSLLILHNNVVTFITSLGSTGATVGQASSRLTAIQSRKMMPQIKARFLKSGWCPSQMEWASRQLAPPDQAVASALKRVRKDNHSVCTEEACVFNRADTKEYHTRHVPDDCTCRHVTEAQIISSQQKDCSPTTIADAAASLLQKDLLPIYTVQKGLVEVSSIVMSSADTPTTYVAISHVWSDGLGNPEFNSLPLCQLIRLQRLVDELYPDMSMDRHVPFWIDTLSVPVKPPTARSSAISKMRETYQKAAKVLVLDAELMSLDIFVPPLELALRVACAGWANRLWTYQEAVLSQDSVYRFRNGFVSQNELQVGYIDNWARNAYSGITTAGQRALQMFTIEWDREDIERGFKLHFVAEALRWRTTTKEEDEAVCLGTICGVDVTAMLKLKTAKERMIKFYQSLDFIPWGLLFSWGSKINQRGFTWAPASFLNRTTMLPRTSKSKGATWSINGLLGRGPGILFSDFGVAHDLRSFFFKDHNTQRWFLVYPVYPFADEDENIPTPYGKTFQKRKTGKAPFDVKRPFTTALLLFDPIERVDTGTNAVYVHIKSLSSGIAGESLIHVSYDEPVNLHTVDKSVLIGHMGQAMVQNFEQPGSTFFKDGLARHGLSVPSTTSWCIE